MKKTRNILWGIFFIIIGLIVAGNILDITDINLFFDGWWATLIIIGCTIGLITEEEKTGNAIGLGLGIVFLLASRDILDIVLILQLLFPAALVCLGLFLIFKDKIDSKRKNKKVEVPKKDTIEAEKVEAEVKEAEIVEEKND